MRRDKNGTMLFLAVAFFMLGMLLLMDVANAQQAPEAPSSLSELLTPELALGRLCASEAGLRTDTGDCGAIHEVIAFRARLLEVSYVEAALRYSRNAIVDRRERTRQWIADLHPDARMPLGWYSHLPWDGRYRRAWLRVYAHASAIIAGRVPSPCDGPVHAWGAPSITQRFLERTRDAELAECGNTLNDFFVIHRYVRRSDVGATIFLEPT